jgi:hypothetical protein
MSDDKIKISLDEAEQAEVPPSTVTTPDQGAPAPAKKYGRVDPPQPSAQSAPSGAGKYGRINTPGPEKPGGVTGFLMRAWVYMPVAGFFAALIAWAIGEAALHGSQARMNDFLDADQFKEFVQAREGFALSVSIWFTGIFIFIAFIIGLAESLVERSPRKALRRGAIALMAGLVLGPLSFFAVEGFQVGDIQFEGLYTLAGQVMEEMDVNPDNIRHPLQWLRRGLVWTLFGVAAGLTYGLTGLTPKKALFGAIGGFLGAGLGALMFDPIAAILSELGSSKTSGVFSRAIAFSLMGGFTGLAVGLVETALKDRWLYVSAGPLAGKQFVLYKARTHIGSDQTCDIYLFKDPIIQPHHAELSLADGKINLLAHAPLEIGSGADSTRPISAGQSVALCSGQKILVGRYTFNFEEKARRAQ